MKKKSFKVGDRVRINRNLPHKLAGLSGRVEHVSSNGLTCSFLGQRNHWFPYSAIESILAQVR